VRVLHYSVVGRVCVASQPPNEDSEQRIKRQQSVEDRGWERQSYMWEDAARLSSV